MEDAQTFENYAILGAPKIAKRLRDSVSHNMYKFLFIGENIELVGTSKIVGRINFDTPMCGLRYREVFIKMRVLLKSQTSLLVLETAKVPQNLLHAWIVTENLWYENQMLGAT